MLLLGFTGRARSGKSECAGAIKDWVEDQGSSCQIFDIGSYIIAYCIERKLIQPKCRVDLTRDDLEVVVRTGRSVRQLSGQDYWLKLIDKDMNASNPDVALVPNIRYPNEVEWLHRRHGLLIRVRALNYDGSEYISQDRDPNDESETALLSTNADYGPLTVKRGEVALLAQLAITTFDFVRSVYD